MITHHISNLGIVLPIIAVIAILIAIFEVWMLINVALNKKISDKAKTWWIIGMVIVHPVVAIVYCFTDRRKS